MFCYEIKFPGLSVLVYGSGFCPPFQEVWKAIKSYFFVVPPNGHIWTAFTALYALPLTDTFVVVLISRCMMISFLTSKLWVKLPLQMFTGSVHTSYLGWSPQPSSFPFKNRFRSIPVEKNFASKFWILSQKNRTKSLLFTLHGPPIKMYVVHFASVGISRWLRDGFLIIRFQIKQIILSRNLVFFLPILLENSKRNSKN